LFRAKGLWSVDLREQQNWSGRGQHVQFRDLEYQKINEFLTVQGYLGSGHSAVVHSVKCGRILLARKTIYAGRRGISKADAVEEVAHLTRLKHSHVVRLIGSYFWRNDLSILMYPVAEYDLNDFLDALSRALVAQHLWEPMVRSCRGFYSCLSSALRHIHIHVTKHMDIKPQNILVRTGPWNDTNLGYGEYHSKVYISDFGTARSYECIEAAETDGYTNFSTKYAAPEVRLQDTRGLAADVFSLGCVFLEIYATLHDITAEDAAYYKAKTDTKTMPSLKLRMKKDLSKSMDKSYAANHGSIQKLFKEHSESLLQGAIGPRLHVGIMLDMLSPMPQNRPTANDLMKLFGERSCCTAGPDDLRAMKIDAHGSQCDPVGIGESKNPAALVPETLYSDKGDLIRDSRSMQLLGMTGLFTSTASDEENKPHVEPHESFFNLNDLDPVERLDRQSYLRGVSAWNDV
jgi:serine/threonine protein kinase